MMDLESLKSRPEILSEINWEMTPLEAVEMFDHRARGMHQRLQVRNPGQRYYFFCVDNWHEAPRLVLKERSVKESRVTAQIQAPAQLLEECVQEHGGRQGLFPLTEALAGWLRKRLFCNG